ncbi:PUA-like domain-containing protein [Hygrophoropsis aurantiaca]|uniref:PUA-like domain-containing protein n=1 Tax=Hygrophoropsis aurantiaca TaxID=72124 RepID=A0ACB8AQ21_9AGAM|nr:PUA-like domain-containing protein [Hygrophoropsis aurantiaca]
MCSLIIQPLSPSDTSVHTIPDENTSASSPADQNMQTRTQLEIEEEEKERKREENAKLLIPAKTFGAVPGVEVGQTWKKRADCPVHRTFLRGIHGSNEDGAYSIVLSNMYGYDEDYGDIIIYTGTGGFEKKYSKNGKWQLSKKQTSDQEFSHSYNTSLYVSRETGNPVRVVRSYKVVSKYAPVLGYRYDGLYIVTDAWKEKMSHGFVICRYRLERMPGQPDLPERTITRRRKRSSSNDDDEADTGTPVAKKRRTAINQAVSTVDATAESAAGSDLSAPPM